MVPLSQMSEGHRAALEEAVAYVRKRYEPWGILAAGTIVGGDPDPHSDIDLYVLHDASFRQRVQRRFNGVPVEIFVNPESAVRGYIEDEAVDGQPITAHMFVTGVPLLGSDDARFEALRRLSQESMDGSPGWSEAQLVQARYGAATLVEDALDRREADPETAMRILSKAMDAVVSYWFKLRGEYQPRNKDVLAAIGDKDPEFGRLCRRFWGDGSSSERWDAALAVADRILETRGFFEWESEQSPAGSD